MKAFKFLFIFLTDISQNDALCQNINLFWQTGYHKTEIEQPSAWIPSTVPLLSGIYGAFGGIFNAAALHSRIYNPANDQKVNKFNNKFNKFNLKF